MKVNNRILLLILGLATFSGCNKREIIPPPSNQIELDNSFIGKFNNSTLELTQNVNGYIGSSAADFVINASDMDKAVYYSTLSSTRDARSISVGHGSVSYEANAGERPAFDIFEDFYTNPVNFQPTFSPGGLNGFKVRFIDQFGRQWNSEDNGSIEDVIYSNVKQVSDATGDYITFRVDFDCVVYRTWSDGLQTFTESMTITDAVYKGWYKR